MRALNKQLTILSVSEEAALYELPEFSNEQRLEYFVLTDQELNLALDRKGLSVKIHCILQIGYFKAVKMFYRITKNDVDPEDYAFINEQYFAAETVEQNLIRGSRVKHLTEDDKKNNQKLASSRVLNENVIGMLKRFKIIADKYRNRRKRFCLRFNLITAIYNIKLV